MDLIHFFYDSILRDTFSFKFHPLIHEEASQGENSLGIFNNV